VEQSGRRDSYSIVIKQFQEQSDQTTEIYEDRSRVGQVICLWTYKAEPAPPGKASFGELSVSSKILVDLLRQLTVTADHTGTTIRTTGVHVKAPHLTHDKFGSDSDVNQCSRTDSRVQVTS